MITADSFDDIIILEGISKSINNQTVLAEITLKLKRGDFVAITGKSGSGKSTLISILSMMLTPDSGTFKFENNNVLLLQEKDMKKLRRNNFGIIFQNYNLIEEFSVLENINFPYMFNQATNYTESYLNEVLDFLKISDKISYFPNELSMGEKQRVAIARALVYHPKIILADEITGNLDSNQSLEIVDLLSEINSKFKTTIIFVTHNLSLIKKHMIHLELEDGKLKPANMP